tara:strand:+ start:161 stop:283 length:123 start_codon:yes stop_codon:yes gene_type:complete
LITAGTTPKKYPASINLSDPPGIFKRLEQNIKKKKRKYDK